MKLFKKVLLVTLNIIGQEDDTIYIEYYKYFILNNFIM